MKNGDKPNGNKPIKRTRMGKKDFAKLGVVCAYIVQHRGTASVQTVGEVLANQCLVTVAPKTVASVLQALQKKNILAIGADPNGLRVYNMKTTQFNARTEIAEFTSLYLAISADAQAVLIQNVLDGGAKTTKEQKYPCKLARMRATILSGILVGQHPLNGSPAHTVAYERSELRAPREENDPGKVFLTFERVGKDKIMINEACIRGWLRRNMKQASMPPAYVDNFGIGPIMFKPSELMIRQLPIQRPPGRTDGGTPVTSIGVGLGDYESVAFETFDWEFTVPTENFMTLEELKGFLALVLEMPRERSYSPGRGTQYGGGSALVNLELVEMIPVPASRQKNGNGTGDLSGVVGDAEAPLEDDVEAPEEEE